MWVGFARITAGKNRNVPLYRHIQPVRSEYVIESDQSKIAVPKYRASYLIEVLPELYIDEPFKRSLMTLSTFLSSRINPRQPATCRSTPSVVSEVHLQLHAVSVFDDGAHNRVLNLAVVQVHADFVADLELPVVWFLCEWHGKECI